MSKWLHITMTASVQLVIYYNWLMHNLFVGSSEMTFGRGAAEYSVKTLITFLPQTVQLKEPAEHGFCLTKCQFKCFDRQTVNMSILFLVCPFFYLLFPFSSRLYNLKNQLNVELDKFMSVIRASLRQFRQHLDETLQMLRESNARFIKSFKWVTIWTFVPHFYFHFEDQISHNTTSLCIHNHWNRDWILYFIIAKLSCFAITIQ